VLGPILYWDLVRYVRSPNHITHRTILAGIVGAFVFLYTGPNDFRRVGAVASSSQFVSVLSFFLQTLAIYLFIPAMLAGSICDDRRFGRLDLLLTTSLSRRRIVLEKFLVGVGIALLAMLTLLPFTLLGPILGGVEPNAVLRAEVAAFVETMFVAAVTLMISARSMNGSEALAKSYLLLFALRYATPQLPFFVATVAPTVSQSPLLWAWLTSISPASAAHAAWLPTPTSAGWPMFGVLLLISLGVTVIALTTAVRNLTRQPVAGSSRSRRTLASGSQEELLDSDPLVWRAVNLRVYDRNGVWRRTIWAIGVLFVVLLWVGFIHPTANYATQSIIFVVVFVVNAMVPMQWLINERQSGWFRELQMTPLAMDDILRAAVEGTSHHLRPLWRLAIAASLTSLALLAIKDYQLAVTLFIIQAMLFWPAWGIYWRGLRQGFTTGRTPAALAQTVWGITWRLGAAFSIGFSFAPTVRIVLFSSDGAISGLPLCFCAAVFVLLAVGAFRKRDLELRKIRTALFVMDTTCNFGHKDVAEVWNDWVGVTRDKSGPRLRDVYLAPAPKLHRSPRR
jgi:ABC-type transport system involved in multi-copper enzyme maturation permease subunit